ncbi:MAG TPA: ribosome assembly cofactor RimP [Flavobacteriaceae bacterium]|jgi:ribosome maturation factor RimP|nr:ribosome assembly cofactor RimP [Flavobacteriaceae bacterium]
MTFKERVQELLNQGLETHPHLFLIDFTVGADQKINVVLDGDQGVTLQDCMDISRAIEHQLDREEFDFALEVASAGATAPLKLARQYAKNIGRTLSVQTADQKVEAELVEADESTILLRWQAREPKPIGKGKHTVEKEWNVPISEIIEAKVIIKF